MLGYFIEITASHEKKVPEYFIHRQTLANNLRYTTAELTQTARAISEAANQALQLELQLFDRLLSQISESSEAIAKAARALATLDVLVSFAQLAIQQRYQRPVIDDSVRFEIKAGRHPVVEAVQANSGGAFIANDCALSDEQRLWLLTGPNMAGKSTFLRQNALIAILAHIGSYVPADSAHIGVIDRLFSRVGAADDLARGQSTFMVEMVETATILNQSTSRSLVILDEIGRGTATFDGLSIAWAVVEYLHEAIGCRSLFATHYHELTTLATELIHLACYTMQVKEWHDQVKFLHQVVAGTADRSYGIHVAKLAGLPETVTHRAQQILHQLEGERDDGTLKQLAEQDLPLFQNAPSASSAQSLLSQKLATIQPDNLSPKEALELLYELKQLD